MNDYTRGMLLNHRNVLDREIECVRKNLDHTDAALAQGKATLADLLSKRAAVTEALA